MQSIITIFRDVQDPRDINARHILSSMLFISVAARLCGAKSSVDIADFADAHVDTLGEIVDLPHGAPSHDSFSRVFRLLDPEELATALTRFAAALRQGLGIGPAKGSWPSTARACGPATSGAAPPCRRPWGPSGTPRHGCRSRPEGPKAATRSRPRWRR